MDREFADLDSIRRRLVQLLENDRWFMLDEDEIEARELLKRYGRRGNQYDIVDFVVSLLQENHPISPVELTNPRYRPGTGYVMKMPRGYDLYIKLRFTGSYTDEKVHIMSFHPQRPC